VEQRAPGTDRGAAEHDKEVGMYIGIGGLLIIIILLLILL
jgi:hypothetical protein